MSLYRTSRIRRFFGVSFLSMSLAVAGLGVSMSEAQAGGRGHGHGHGHYRHHDHNNGAGVAAAIGLAAIVGIGLMAAHSNAEARRRESTTYVPADERYGPAAGYGDEYGYENDYDAEYGPSAYDEASYVPYSDPNCRQTREYTTTVIIGGRAQEAYGTACLMPDGSWRRGPAALVPGY